MSKLTQFLGVLVIIITLIAFAFLVYYSVEIRLGIIGAVECTLILVFGMATGFTSLCVGVILENQENSIANNNNEEVKDEVVKYS